MRIALVSTYPPRECGIATFTADLRLAMLDAGSADTVDVVAIQRAAEDHPYPPEVVYQLHQEKADDYRRAAAFLNDAGYDLVCLQHEFGIFGGGEAGPYVLELLRRLRMPLVVTLHTVLSQPPGNLRDVLVAVADNAERLVALADSAMPLLAGVYGIDTGKVGVIRHGVPDLPWHEEQDDDRHKALIGAEDRFLLLTFGLLSRDKGIEVVLDALPEVVAARPDTLYIVLGATHPEVRRSDGEEYRKSLQERVDRLRLTGHVAFHDRYVALDELCVYLRACDLYITPYRSREQISSGTLAYALGLGKPVVSTPYPCAKELLADGRGRLVPYDDPEAMAGALLDLIADPDERARIRRRAYRYSRQATWPEVGCSYRRLCAEVVAGGSRPRRREATGPAIRLHHLERLTDDTGILQHAVYDVPDRRHGYTTDDASRALLVAVEHHERFRDPVSLRLAGVYAAFLQHAQRPDGRFRNVMDYDRRWRDEVGTQDTLGQALWGLAAAMLRGPTDGIRALAERMVRAAVSPAEDLIFPRAAAYAICGLSAVVDGRDGERQAAAVVRTLADRLAHAFERNVADGWPWFDDALTYANAKVCEAMLRAGRTLQRPDWTDVGLRALGFVLDQSTDGEQFDFVGNARWYHRGGVRSVFDQQPIEAGYTAQACRLAYDVTGDETYLDRAHAAVQWLHGRNRLGIPLYDPRTGACADGLERSGVNRNCGAESAICCLLGMLAVATDP